MMRPLPSDDRVLELLTDIASGEAGDEARAELRERLGPEAEALIEEFELGAASADLAFTGAMRGETEAMPASARAKVDAAAVAFLNEAAGGKAAAPIPMAARPQVVVRKSSRVLALSGWLAAAACLALAGALWFTAAQPPEGARGMRLSVGERLDALLASGSAVITAPWIGVGDLPVEGVADHELDRGVGGEVIWSDDADQGFMRISGIAPNDPREYQYQLWIFDAERPVGELPDMAIPGLPDLLTQRPVDGGVFDIAPGGEALIPIDAKLPVGAGTIFAVTKERPGGVVVSDREIVFLAVRG